jgi:DNA-binding IclR family transcriptional regulator
VVRQIRNEDESEGDEKPVYTAPALEKGLDVLELLAREEHPLTAGAIVQKLGRSHGELFRMIQVLERRGFVAQAESGYSLTSRMFEIGIERPPLRNLVEIALPVMRELTFETGQSSQLTFHSVGQMVVVARMESMEEIGFTVRVGYRKPLYQTTSGATLFAFQPPQIQKEWEGLFDPKLKKSELAAFRATCELIRAQGYANLPSGFIDGITDLSAPIIRGDRAAAAMAVPFVHSRVAKLPKEGVIRALRAAAARVASELVPSDNRL